MATNWVCPIDGCIPADVGSATSGSYGPDQTKGANSLYVYNEGDSSWSASTGSQVAINGAAALGDFNGLPPHCPICGSALLAASATLVTTRTGVASGSQHPADIDATYVTATDAPTAQYTTAPYAIVGGQSVQPSTFTAGGGSAHTVQRGTVAVTAETVNGTQGP